MLIDLVTKPIPWFGSKSQSMTSTNFNYGDMTMQQEPWAPDIMRYLEDELRTLTLGQDPDPRLTSKDGLIANTMQLHVFWALDAALVNYSVRG